MENNQKIVGNNNIQVNGDYIQTHKIVNKKEIIYDKDYHITDEQALNIRELIKKIAEETSNYAGAYNALYKHFRITSYKTLPKDKYDEAVAWLKKVIAINRNKLKKKDSNQWRKDLYRSIHTRANEIGINIHDFANDKLKIKKPITSLTELSDTRLKKLYEYLFG